MVSLKKKKTKTFWKSGYLLEDEVTSEGEKISKNSLVTKIGELREQMRHFKRKYAV